MKQRVEEKTDDEASVRSVEIVRPISCIWIDGMGFMRDERKLMFLFQRNP